MKLALALLLMAAALAWTGAELRGAAGEPIVSAARAKTGAAQQTQAPPQRSAVIEGAPSLFRPISATGGAADRPGVSFALVGIVARDRERIALLRDEADQRAWRVRVRDRVGDWTVTRIDARCVLLRRSGGARQQRCI
ncbi:MAG: hypothetical protein JNJ73_15350 [Hyphomonadaceae bacterium]|nr:hypothetical protein [Hyphomonadaceae bacterium]